MENKQVIICVNRYSKYGGLEQVVVDIDKLIGINYFRSIIEGNYEKQYDESGRLIIKNDKLEDIIGIFYYYIKNQPIYNIYQYQYEKLLEFIDYIQDDKMNEYILNKLIQENNQLYTNTLKHILNNKFHLHALLKVLSNNMTINECVKLRVTLEEYDKTQSSRGEIYQYLNTLDNKLYTNIYTGLYNIDTDIIKYISILKLEKDSYLIKEKINYYDTIFSNSTMDNELYYFHIHIYNPVNNPHSLVSGYIDLELEDTVTGNTKESLDYDYKLNEDDYKNLFGNRIDKIKLFEVFDNNYGISMTINGTIYFIDHPSDKYPLYSEESYDIEDIENIKNELNGHIGKTILDIKINKVEYPDFDPECPNECCGAVETYYDIIFTDGSIFKICITDYIEQEDYENNEFSLINIYKEQKL